MNDARIAAAFGHTMHEVVRKSEEAGRQLLPQTTIDHFRYMNTRMVAGLQTDGDFDVRKLATWLGYLQGAVGPHGAGVLTMEELKEINRRWST